MLCKIDNSLVVDARRILTLLCFALRPLKVPELIEGVAIDISSTRLNLKRRLLTFDEIHNICLGLVDNGVDTSNMAGQNKPTQTVRIAHFSVQEYLESQRIRSQKAVIYSLNAVAAHAEIAQICLIYLLGPGLAIKDTDAYPLSPFCRGLLILQLQEREST